MKLKIIACDIVQDEIEYLRQKCPHQLDIDYLSREGYHTKPRASKPLLQAAIDKVPEGYDYILLGFALCNKLVDGITTRHTPLVIPRAHDCITFLLGSRQRYQTMFSQNPGTYYYSSGWLKRQDNAQMWQVMDEIPGMEGITYEDLLEKFGEDNVDYIMEVLGQWINNYKKGVLITLPIYDNQSLKDKVMKICAENNWQYGETEGDLSLIERFINGDWDDDFLIVKPGEFIEHTFSDQILTILRSEQGNL